MLVFPIAPVRGLRRHTQPITTFAHPLLSLCFPPPHPLPAPGPWLVFCPCQLLADQALNPAEELKQEIGALSPGKLMANVPDCSGAHESIGTADRSTEPDSRLQPPPRL